MSKKELEELKKDKRTNEWLFLILSIIFMLGAIINGKITWVITATLFLILMRLTEISRLMLK